VVGIKTKNRASWPQNVFWLHLVRAKWSKLVPDFIKTLNENFQSNTNTFQGSKFRSHLDLVLCHFVENQNILLKNNFWLIPLSTVSQFLSWYTINKLVYYKQLRIMVCDFLCIVYQLVPVYKLPLWQLVYYNRAIIWKCLLYTRYRLYQLPLIPITATPREKIPCDDDCSDG
jgi:hypothetical protein